MKTNLLASLFVISSVAFAQLGEGAKPGCNPAEWECDTVCQERKAKECGLALDSSRDRKDLSQPTSTGGSRGKKKAGQQ